MRKEEDFKGHNHSTEELLDLQKGPTRYLPYRMEAIV